MSYQFTQKKGPRAGQKYNVKRGASGLDVRVYETGDTTLPKGKPAAYARGLGGRTKSMTSDSAVSQVTPRRDDIRNQIARVKDPNPFKGKQPAPDLTKARELLLRQRVEAFAKKEKRKTSNRQAM